MVQGNVVLKDEVGFYCILQIKIILLMQTNAKSTNLLKGHKRTERSQTIAIAMCSHKGAIKTVGSSLKAIHV